MGVVISQKPSGGWARPAVRLLILLLVGAAALTLFRALAYREPPSEDWTLDQLTRAVREAEVSRLYVSSDRVIVETKAGARGQIRYPERISIIDFLRERDIPEGRLSELSVVKTQPSRPLQWLWGWLWSVPVVILILGLGGILVKRAPSVGRPR